MMELSSRPRHQIRAQGRRKGHAGFVIVENETSRLRWHPGAERAGTSVAVAEKKKGKRGSLELLEFLSRTAVQAEKELLSTLDEPQTQSETNSSLSEFRRIISNVQKNDRSAFRTGRTEAAGRKPEQCLENGEQIARGESVARVEHIARGEHGDDSESAEHLALESADGTDSPHVDALADASSKYVAHVLEHPEEITDADQSGRALRSLLKELNEWLSASNVTGPSNDSSQTGSYPIEDLPTPQFRPPGKNVAAAQQAPVAETTARPDMALVQSHFGFEQAKDWTYAASQKVAEEARSHKAVTNKLSPFLAAAKRTVMGVKNLPLGRRIESHENGAVLEKDELGRVTQIRARCGEIISIYYGRDGAPEGFVRTDAKGVLHSVAECDAQGVVLRDENGRVRAAGESLSIDPLGRISISRSDGQYWSIDLARQMLSEKRRLSDAKGKWTALTAVFAADGFRMMTLFQKLSPNVGQQVRSHDEANRIWSSAAVETGNFRFYGRDGSTIEFDSEEALANFAPMNVSSPAVRPIEPRWQAKQQAGTAWQSVHEYVVGYLAT